MIKRLFLLLGLAGLLVTANVVVLAPTAARAAFYPNEYWIVNRNSLMCLDALDGSPRDGTPIQQWNCNDFNQQNWGFNEIARLSDGRPLFKIAAKHTNYQGCLDVWNGNASNGTPVQLWSCRGYEDNNQQFIQEYRATYSGVHYAVYKPYHAQNMCLDISGGSPSRGARLQIWPCHYLANQLFTAADAGPR
jgi:hypothetical protein